MPRMETLQQAAVESGLTYNCLRQMCLKGEIVHIRVGKKIMVNMDKLEKYLNGESGNESRVD